MRDLPMSDGSRLRTAKPRLFLKSQRGRISEWSPLIHKSWDEQRTSLIAPRGFMINEILPPPTDLIALRMYLTRAKPRACLLAWGEC